MHAGRECQRVAIRFDCREGGGGPVLVWQLLECVNLGVKKKSRKVFISVQNKEVEKLRGGRR